MPNTCSCWRRCTNGPTPQTDNPVHMCCSQTFPRPLTECHTGSRLLLKLDCIGVRGNPLRRSQLQLLPLFEKLVVSTSSAVFCILVFLDFVCFVYYTNLPIGFFSMLLCILSYCQLILSVFVLGSTTIGLPLCNPFLVWIKSQFTKKARQIPPIV